MPKVVTEAFKPFGTHLLRRIDQTSLPIAVISAAKANNMSGSRISICSPCAEACSTYVPSRKGVARYLLAGNAIIISIKVATISGLTSVDWRGTCGTSRVTIWIVNFTRSSRG